MTHLGDQLSLSKLRFERCQVMTAGEAGMITTSNEALFKKMQSIKEFGKEQLLMCNSDILEILGLPRANNHLWKVLLKMLGYYAFRERPKTFF